MADQNQLLYDKTGRQIEVGDIVKVFHFVGARKKRYYMYKQAIGTKRLSSETEYMMFSHLDMNDAHYLEACDGRRLKDYEIVQSIDAKFEQRPRSSSPISDDRPSE